MSVEEKRRMVEVGKDRGRSVRRVVSVRGNGGSSHEAPSAPLSGPPSDKKGVQRAAATLFSGLGTTTRPKPTVSPERKRWEEATSDLTSIHGRPYDPERAYHEGDIILHKQFGMGVVEGRHETDGSIDVLFRDGSQLLAAAASEA